MRRATQKQHHINHRILPIFLVIVSAANFSDERIGVNVISGRVNILASISTNEVIDALRLKIGELPRILACKVEYEFDEIIWLNETFEMLPSQARTFTTTDFGLDLRQCHASHFIWPCATWAS